MTYKNKFNKKIHKLFLDDQKDHSAQRIVDYKTEDDWKHLEVRDKKRQKEILSILKDKKLSFTGEDYFMAAIIFQHGRTIADSKKAISLAKRGVNLGNDKSKWLYAAATDRLLIRQKKKQKFGTQYFKKRNKWFLGSVNPKTTDEERIAYNILPLKQAKAKAEKWNKKGIDPWEEKRKTAGIASTK